MTTGQPIASDQRDALDATHETEIEGVARGHQTISFTTPQEYSRFTNAELKREESTKDNDLRRHIIRYSSYLVIGIISISWVIGLLMVIISNDHIVQQSGAAIATAIVGGALGGLGGYFAGRGKR
jgi:uncharacterized membrane-anchored protein